MLQNDDQEVPSASAATTTTVIPPATASIDNITEQLMAISDAVHRLDDAGVTGDSGASSSSDRSRPLAVQDDEPVVVTEPASSPQNDLKDLIKGKLSDTPWQHQRYAPGSALWQGSARRRKIHQRRSVSGGLSIV